MCIRDRYTCVLPALFWHKCLAISFFGNQLKKKYSFGLALISNVLLHFRDPESERWSPIQQIVYSYCLSYLWSTWHTTYLENTFLLSSSIYVLFQGHILLGGSEMFLYLSLSLSFFLCGLVLFWFASGVEGEKRFFTTDLVLSSKTISLRKLAWPPFTISAPSIIIFCLLLLVYGEARSNWFWTKLKLYIICATSSFEVD